MKNNYMKIIKTPKVTTCVGCGREEVSVIYKNKLYCWMCYKITKEEEMI